MDNYYDPWSNTKTKHGMEADLVISALQKCIRRGNEEVALRMAYELYITSEFHEDKLWTRLLVIAVEDIGFGNPEAHGFVRGLFESHKEFPYGSVDRSLFFLFAIRYLCKCKKERSTCDILCLLMRESERGELPEIPEYAIDMHTIKGRAMGKDIFYFLDEGSKVEPLWEGYDDSYFRRFYQICEEERDQKADNMS